MRDRLIGAQTFDRAVPVWYPWAMDNLLPLAYMATVDDEPMDSGGAVQCLCADCATKKAGGDIAAYNEARGFDWRGAWMLSEVEDLQYFQERNGLVVGDPIFVLFGDGMTINQAVAVNAEAIAKKFGVRASEVIIVDGPDPDPVEFDCAQCEAACITIDASLIMDSPE